MYCSVLRELHAAHRGSAGGGGCCWELEALLQMRRQLPPTDWGLYLGGHDPPRPPGNHEQGGSAIFDNLPIIFAIGVAIGMAKAEKEVAAFSAAIAFFVMNVSISAVLRSRGKYFRTEASPRMYWKVPLPACAEYRHFKWVCLGGIIVGLGVAALHNRFHKILLPNAFPFRRFPVCSRLFPHLSMYLSDPVSILYGRRFRMQFLPSRAGDRNRISGNPDFRYCEEGVDTPLAFITYFTFHSGRPRSEVR